MTDERVKARGRETKGRDSAAHSCSGERNRWVNSREQIESVTL